MGTTYWGKAPRYQCLACFYLKANPGLLSVGRHHILPSCKVMLKILQARLQQYMNRELPDVQAGCRKQAFGYQGRTEGERDKLRYWDWHIHSIILKIWKFGKFSKFGKLRSGHRTGKGHFSFQSQRKVMPKNTQATAQ